MGKLNTKAYKNETFIAIIALFVIFVINVPYLLLGDNFYPRFGYDSLDSNVIKTKIFFEGCDYFAPRDSIVEQPMGGLPRALFGMGLSISTIWYMLFSFPTAYVVNIIMIQLLAFLGMVLFLKTKYGNNHLLIYSVALVFSQLPYWPHAGLSVAGIPLLLYSFLKFKDKKFLSIIVMLIYILYSSFVLTGMFLIMIGWLFWLGKVIKRKKDNNLLIYLVIFTLLSILRNYDLFLLIIDPIFVSHRSEAVIHTFGIYESLKSFINMVFFEYGHNLKKPIIIIITFIIVSIIAKIKKIKIQKDIYYIFGAIIFLSFISVFMQSTTGYWITSHVKTLKLVQLQRFYWLLPPLFYILFYLVLREIWKTKLKALVLVLLVIQFGLIFQKNTNFKEFLKTRLLGKETKTLTYKEFYSEVLYQEINDYIGKPQNSYRVASIGLQPAAALYSGFYTIDGYFANYPLSYKHKFYELMEPELNKNEIAKDFFEDFGSVVVILSNEIIERREGKGFIIPTEEKTVKNRVINNLQLNTDVLQGLNCQYIFSSSEILNHKELNFKFEKYFERDDSPWAIYLYSVICNNDV